MTSLLPLPPVAAGEGCSRLPRVMTSIDTLRQTYFTAKSMLASGDFELQRVCYHRDSLIRHSLPQLAALEEVAVDECIPIEWLHDSAQRFGALLLELLEAEKAIEGKCIILQFYYTNPYISFEV